MATSFQSIWIIWCLSIVISSSLAVPTAAPSEAPSVSPSESPSMVPSQAPSTAPSAAPSLPPTDAPSVSPSLIPSLAPSQIPSTAPSNAPTLHPSEFPSQPPSQNPTQFPSLLTDIPTISPSRSPTMKMSPSRAPSQAPSSPPTQAPTMAPTVERFAELVLYYNHSIDFFETDLFEYVDVLNEAVKRALLATINDTKPKDNDTYNRIETAVGGVDMCAVFSLNLYCDDRDFDGDEPRIDDKFGNKDQKRYQSRFYASGMVVYAGNDRSDAITKSRLINALILDNLVLFEQYIEQSMNEMYGNWLATLDNSNELGNRRRRLQDISEESTDYNTAFQIGDLFFENLEFKEDKDEKDGFDNYGLTVNYIQYAMFAAIAGVIIMVLLTKSHSLTIGADTTHPSGLIFFTLFVWDFYSDLFFVIRMFLVGAYDCLAVALFFTLVPYALNLRELLIWEKKWLRDLTIQQGLTEYLERYRCLLIACSLISGSSFATIEMVNSNMFGIRFFSMGLTDRHMKRYNTRRLYSNILTENIPQLIIQVWYTLVYGGVINKGADAIDSVVIYAFCSSVVSIMVSVIDVYSSRKLIRHMKDANMYYQDDEMQMDDQNRRTISNSISNKTFYIVIESTEIEERRKVLLQRTGPIREALGEVIEIHTRLINLQQFVPKYTGVRIAFTVFSDKVPKEQITSKLCKAMKNGQIAQSVQFGWKLLYLPEVTSIETLVGNLICPVRPDGTIVHPETGEPIIEGDLRVDEYGVSLSVSVIGADEESGRVADFASEKSDSDSIFEQQRRFSNMFGFKNGNKNENNDQPKKTLKDRNSVNPDPNANDDPSHSDLAPPPPSTARESFAKRMSGMIDGITINLNNGKKDADSKPKDYNATRIGAPKMESEKKVQYDTDNTEDGPAMSAPRFDRSEEKAATTMAPPPPSTDRPSFALSKRLSGMGKRMSGMFSRPQQSTMQQLESAHQTHFDQPMAVSGYHTPPPGMSSGFPSFRGPYYSSEAASTMSPMMMISQPHSMRSIPTSTIPVSMHPDRPPYIPHGHQPPPFQVSRAPQDSTTSMRTVEKKTEERDTIPVSTGIKSIPSSVIGGAIPPTSDTDPSTSFSDINRSSSTVHASGYGSGGGPPTPVTTATTFPPISPYSTSRPFGPPPFGMAAPMHPSGVPPPFTRPQSGTSDTGTARMTITPVVSPMQSPMHGHIPAIFAAGQPPPFQPGVMPGSMVSPLGSVIPAPMMGAGSGTVVPSPPALGPDGVPVVPPPFVMPANGTGLGMLSDTESSMEESEFESESDISTDADDGDDEMYTDLSEDESE